MFSPLANAAPSTAVRTRRRRRPLSSEGSISQPKAKRQRSVLSDQTFIAPDATSEAQHGTTEKATTGQTARAASKHTGLPTKDLAVREKKPKAGERGSKGDGSVTLVGHVAHVIAVDA